MDPKEPNKLVMFFIFVIGVGLAYPLIMSAIFKFDVKTSIIIGGIFGVVGGIIWVVTSNIREKRKAAKK